MNEHARPAASAPHRPIAYAAPRVTRTDRPDGSIIISGDTLGAYDPSLARLFRAAVDAQRIASSCKSAPLTAGASSPMRMRAARLMHSPPR